MARRHPHQAVVLCQIPAAGVAGELVVVHESVDQAAHYAGPAVVGGAGDGLHVAVGVNRRVVFGCYDHRTADGYRTLLDRVADISLCQAANHVAGQNSADRLAPGANEGRSGRSGVVPYLGVNLRRGFGIQCQIADDVQARIHDVGFHFRGKLVADTCTDQCIDGPVQNVLRCPTDGVEGQRHADSPVTGGGRTLGGSIDGRGVHGIQGYVAAGGGHEAAGDVRVGPA